MPACANAALINTVSYTTLPGVPKAQTSIDLYQCSKSANSLVVYIHGGAWTSGDKKNVHSMPVFFADNNVCYASANYPLIAPGGKSLIDLQVNALSSLDAWLQKSGKFSTHQRAYQNISIIAHSAGAHLVALADKRKRWNPFVRNLFLMDSGSYDIAAKFEKSSPRYRLEMSKLLQLEMYPPAKHRYILEQYSPALLPSRPKSGSKVLNVFIITSSRPTALGSAKSLQNSYRSVPGYSAKLFQLDWKHEDFPRNIGVKPVFSQRILRQAIVSDL